MKPKSPLSRDMKLAEVPHATSPPQWKGASQVTGLALIVSSYIIKRMLEEAVYKDFIGTSPDNEGHLKKVINL